MNALVYFGLCTLSDKELITKVDKMTDGLFEGNRGFLTRNVPARPNEDYDLLVGELIKRFSKRIEEGQKT